MIKPCFIFFILFAAKISHSQEIGISASKLSTDNYELHNPLGLVVHLAQPLFKKAKIQFEYAYYKNTREYYGYLVSGFMPYPPPAKETVRSESMARSWDVSLNFEILHMKMLTARAGGGIGMTYLRGNREGLETKKRASIFKENKFGISFMFLIESARIMKSPFSAFIMGRFKTTDDSTPPTDVESPFSAGIKTAAVNIGLLMRLLP